LPRSFCAALFFAAFEPAPKETIMPAAPGRSRIEAELAVMKTCHIGEDGFANVARGSIAVEMVYRGSAKGPGMDAGMDSTAISFSA
jgi:hypothetical protein